ncbi:MAG: hypothetical protein J7L69_05120 [Desulfobulbaceae bacterium]|nr:hypothetical protein [Desulfobulbaceae bacterium]
MSKNQKLKTPEKVALATKVLYSIIAINFIRIMITVFRHWGVRTPDFLVFTSIFLWVISFFLIYQINKGKNWARWSMVLIFAISIPLSILPTLSSLTHNPIPNLLRLLQVVLYIWTLILLFHTTSTRFFKNKT